MDSDLKNARNVLSYIFGRGAINNLKDLLLERKVDGPSCAVYFVDKFFENFPGPLESLCISELDQVLYVDTQEEPTTDYVNDLKD